MTSVSVIGLGKLGVCMAAAMASRGHTVVGVDVVPDTIEKVNNGVAPVVEPQLQEYISANRDRIRATADYEDAITSTDISFIVVPTPSDERGYFDIKYAQQAFASIGDALKKKTGYHLVILTSTVLPGATRYGCLPLLLKAVGKKKAGQDFGICYSPEFIALGSVIRDFLNPDVLLIGEYDKKSGTTLKDFYKTVMSNRPKIHRMSIENAELAKIALNSYVTMKITYANVIGALCEKLPGGDCDAVLGAVGDDSRVGKKYLRTGLGYGGPCFPRDNQALASFAQDLGVDARLMKQTDAVNTTIPFHIQSSIRKYLTEAPRILILGTSYKPLSPLTEESQAFELAKLITQDHKNVHTWDPVAPCTLPGKPDYKEYTHIILANWDPAFSDMVDGALAPGTVVVDLWRSHPHLEENPFIRYVPLGKCRNDELATMRLVKGMPHGGCV